MGFGPPKSILFCMGDKKLKTINNLRSILINNFDFIERIIVSEAFMQEIVQYPDLIQIDVYFDEELGNVPLMLGIPIVESQTMTKNAVLEMKNEEYIIINL